MMILTLHNLNKLDPSKPDDAVTLWRLGEDTWNAWVKQHPVHDISFARVDFSKYIEESVFISFQGFIFPKGNVSFRWVKFGNSNVNFSLTEFGDGDVDFSLAEFGDGDVSFMGAQFGKGVVQFGQTQFGDGAVYFLNCHFEGAVLFLELKIIEKIKSFSFESTVFDGPFNISSDETFPCIIDLTHTKTSHHISLAGVKCAPCFFPDGDWVMQKTMANPEDIVRARRLKELAEANKDHQAAQNFHVLEMQAKRVHSKCPIGYLWSTEFWYEKLSDYGRSIKRPVGRLIFIWLLWSEIYMMVSIIGKKNAIESFTVRRQMI